MSDAAAIDRDFGAPDERTWPTTDDLCNEIVRGALDAIDAHNYQAEPLLRVLLDVARLRAALAPEEVTS
jgi:hypothetical protein